MKEKLKKLPVQIAVRAIIVNSKLEVMLIKRALGSFEESKWCLVGGKPDKGENLDEAVESEEMTPKWFDLDKVPFNDMWPGDSYWMTLVFAGKKVRGEFIFSGEGGLKEYKIKEVA